jgi:hypothetical protein
VDAPIYPTCGQPASEALGGPEPEWECRNEACAGFVQPVSGDEAPACDRARRLAFAIPPIEQPPEGVEWLDPADEDDRSVLLDAAHPELDPGEETAGEMNPRQHHRSPRELLGVRRLERQPRAIPGCCGRA